MLPRALNHYVFQRHIFDLYSCVNLLCVRIPLYHKSKRYFTTARPDIGRVF